MRTSAFTPSATPTQVMAALTLTLSAPGVPLLVSGTTVASTSVTWPSASLVQPVHSMT